MPNLSVRGLGADSLSVLKAMAGQEGASVNALVLRLIDQGLGKVPRKMVKRRFDDLDALAGAWSADESANFEASVEGFNKIDPDLWK